MRKTSFINIDDARKQISRDINFYNTEKLHSSLFYLTPEDVFLGRADDRLNERQRKLNKVRIFKAEANRAA